MANIVQLHGMASAAAASYVGPQREIIVDTGANALRIQDGATPGGFTTMQGGNNLSEITNSLTARENIGAAPLDGPNFTTVSGPAQINSDNIVTRTSPTLITPNLGVAKATSLSIGGAALGGNVFSAIGACSASGGFNDQGNATGFTTTGFGFSAIVGPTQISVTYSSYAIVVTSDMRLKTKKKDRINYREAIKKIWVGDFNIYSSKNKRGKKQRSFGVIAQEFYRLFNDGEDGRFGIRKPSKKNKYWQASAEPVGYIALKGASIAINEIDELRAEITKLKAQLARR